MNSTDPVRLDAITDRDNFKFTVTPSLSIIKVPKPHTHPTLSNTVAPILRELCIHEIRHPSIVELMGVCVFGPGVCGLQFVKSGQDLLTYLSDIMEKVAQTVSDRAQIHEEYRTNGVSDRELHQMAETLIDCLAFLHEQEIYHMDIKPDNILMREDGRLQLIDFGLAHSENWRLTRGVDTEFGQMGRGFCIGSLRDAQHRDRRTLYFGSPSYLPDIERATQQDFLLRRDQWALGCVLHICAYGSGLR